MLVNVTTVEVISTFSSMPCLEIIFCVRQIFNKSQSTTKSYEVLWDLNICTFNLFVELCLVNSFVKVEILV